MADNEDPVQCILNSLRLAKELHQKHLDDPSTATEESQMELMKLIEEAEKCANEA